MKNRLNRLAAVLACAALIAGLTFPARAAEAPASIRASSYKGNVLSTGEISGLMLFPSSADSTAVSDAPDVVSVAKVLGHWTATAQGPGTATITINAPDGGTASVTITVEPAEPTAETTEATVPGSNENTGDCGDKADTEALAENLEIRQELVRLINQTRKANGVAELPVNDALMNAAQDCSAQGFEAHDTQYECESALRHGYPNGFGSNLTVFTYNSSTNIPQRAVSHWTYSPGHFQTMTADRYDSIGVGVTLCDDVAYCYMLVGNSNSYNPYA